MFDHIAKHLNTNGLKRFDRTRRGLGRKEKMNKKKREEKRRKGIRRGKGKEGNGRREVRSRRKVEENRKRKGREDEREKKIRTLNANEMRSESESTRKSFRPNPGFLKIAQEKNKHVTFLKKEKS